MDIEKAIQKQLKAKLNNVIYLMTKQSKWDSDDDDGKDTNKTDKITQQITRKLDKIEAYIQREVGKSIKRRPKDEGISQGQASAVINMVEHLKALIIGK